uniref:Uncharacterized protein n=1 Tax=Rhizophora mucronata TaxID=61149 RepID=A0A2P2MYL0_RHIMU
MTICSPYPMHNNTATSLFIIPNVTKDR